MVYSSNSYNLKDKNKNKKTNLLFQQTEQFYDEMTRARFPPPPQLFRILLGWSSFAPAKENGSVCYVQLHFALKKSEASNQRKSNDSTNK